MFRLLGTGLLCAALATSSIGAASVAASSGAEPIASSAKKKKKKKKSKSKGCDPGYKGACLKPNVSDYDCAGGSGNGPYYVSGPLKVVGDDQYDLDRDGNGIACE